MKTPSIKMPKKSVEERREQVLEVLIKLLNSEEGMQRVTTERLAKAVGVSEGALYRYFPSKTKMFEALIERIEQVLNKYIGGNKQKQTAEDAAKAVLSAILEFAQKNPGVTRILAGHALMFEDDLLKERVSKFFEGLEIQFFNLLQIDKRRGIIYPEAREMASYLVNFCEGQFLRMVRSNFKYYEHQQFEKQWQLIRPIFHLV